MKKVITHSDGRKEEIEGTAEELAEYENKLKSETPKKNKKLLTEKMSLKDLGEFVKENADMIKELLAEEAEKIREEIRQQQQYIPLYQPVAPSYDPQYPFYKTAEQYPLDIKWWFKPSITICETKTTTGNTLNVGENVPQ